MKVVALVGLKSEGPVRQAGKYLIRYELTSVAIVSSRRVVGLREYSCSP